MKEEKKIPSPSDSQQPAMKRAAKQERERDAVLAMREYEAEKLAVLARTARLRALRLAKEAGDAPRKTPKRRLKQDR